MATSFQSKVGRDSARTLVTGAVASVFAILTGIVIANTLGPTGKGEYSGVQLLYTGVLSIVGGIGSAITYYLTKGKRSLRSLAAPLTRIFVVLCVAFWLGMYVWGILQGRSLALLVFSVAVPACVIISWQPSIYVSFDRIKNLNFLNVFLAAVTLFGALISLLILHTSVIGPLAAWVIGLYAVAFAVLHFAYNRLKGERVKDGTIGDTELLSFSFRASLNSLIAFLNARIDSILVIALVGITAFGVYSMATGIAELLYSLSQSFATAVARPIGVSDFKVSAAMTAKAVRLNTIVVTGVSFLIFAVAPVLIQKIYGNSFLPATTPLRILLFGVVVFSSARVFNAFFTYQLGRPIFSVYLMLAVTVLQALGCVGLIPKFGLAGAALASTTAYVIATLGQSWYFCKITGLPLGALWVPRSADVSQMYGVVAATAKSAFSTR